MRNFNPYSNDDINHRLDRDFHREPTYGRDRQRIPLNEAGALKTHFAKKHVATPVVPEEKPWRPADKAVAA